MFVSAVREQAIKGEQEDARDGHQLRRSLNSHAPILHDSLPRLKIGKHFRSGIKVSYLSIELKFFMTVFLVLRSGNISDIELK